MKVHYFFIQSYLSLSDKRGSNPRPSAWEADALPTELLSQLWVVASLIGACTLQNYNFIFKNPTFKRNFYFFYNSFRVNALICRVL